MPLNQVETQVTTLETGTEQQLLLGTGVVHPPPATTVRLEKMKAPLAGVGQRIAPTQTPPPPSEEVSGRNPRVEGGGGDPPLISPPPMGEAAMSERELYKGFTP